MGRDGERRGGDGERREGGGGGGGEMREPEYAFSYRRINPHTVLTMATTWYQNLNSVPDFFPFTMVKTGHILQ